MPDYPGPLGKLIGAQEKIHPHDGKLQHESCQKPQRDGVAPHIYNVTDKAETAVSPCAEDACNQGGIYGSPHHIISIDEKHILEIMHGLVRQMGIAQHQGSGAENDDSADGSGNHRELHQLSRIRAGFFQFVLSDYISQKDTACTGHSKAQYRAEISHYNHKRICRHRICSQMSDDDRVDGKGHTPGNVVAQRRKREPDKIGEQDPVPDKESAQIQLDFSAAERNRKTCRQLHQPGQRCGNGHTLRAQLRRAEKAEDEDCIQQDIQGKGQQVQGCADHDLSDASEHGQIDFRDSPAQVTDTHKAEVGSTDGYQLRIIGENVHHVLRRQKGQPCKKQGKTQRKAQCDALDYLDGPHVFFPIILGTEHGGSGAQPIKYHKKHIGILGSQGNRRYGGLPHIIQHDDIRGTDGGAQQVLDDDGQYQPENSIVKRIIFP